MPPCNRQEDAASSGHKVDRKATADVNGDGKLDLITAAVEILLGKGDGTFTHGDTVELDNPFSYNVNVGDFNGDGIPDIAVNDFPPVSIYFTQTVDILLGKGNGTFQDPLVFASNYIQITGGGVYYGLGLAMGDFNGDGKLDLVNGDINGASQPLLSVFLSTSASVSPSSLDFGKQQIGQKSAPQVVKLKNIGLGALPLQGIHIKGTNAKDFSQSNKCGSKLAAGATCSIKVFFKPAQTGTRTAQLMIAYTGAGSPQSVALSGIGVNTQVTLKPPKLDFPLQLVGTQSTPQTATLKNIGTETVTISKVSTSGPFSQTNNCGGSLNPGATCQIQVTFVPTGPGDAAGTLKVTDNALDSPQTVALSGLGTIVKLSPLSINFGGQPVGTTSPAVPVTLANKGNVTLNISAIQITGANASDFAQTNNCGNTLPAGSSCKIKVTFTPTAQGARSATLSITDDGGGSPQTVPLAGTGT